MKLQCYFIQPTSERDDWVGVLCDEDASLGQLSCMQIDTGCEPWRVEAILCSAEYRGQALGLLWHGDAYAIDLRYLFFCQ